MFAGRFAAKRKRLPSEYIYIYKYLLNPLVAETCAENFQKFVIVHFLFSSLKKKNKHLLREDLQRRGKDFQAITIIYIYIYIYIYVFTNIFLIL